MPAGEWVSLRHTRISPKLFVKQGSHECACFCGFQLTLLSAPACTEH